MRVLRRPLESAVRRLLAGAGLPAADITPAHLEHFFGCGSEQAPSGVVGLEVYGPQALLRSLAVEESARGRGHGRALVAEAERYAWDRGVERIYLLTTTAEGFFASLGYAAIAREEAPPSIRATSEFSALCPSTSVLMCKDLATAPGFGSTPASGDAGGRAETFSPRAATFRGRFVVAGEVEDVFPLFSPVGERSWVPGWDPELLHPAGVEWAQGQIFRTREETGEAVWVVARLDREGHEVEYYRVEPGRYVARIEVRCRPADDRATRAEISYSFVGLSERGNGDIGAMSQEAYDEKMARWKAWIGSHLAARGRSS